MTPRLAKQKAISRRPDFRTFSATARRAVYFGSPDLRLWLTMIFAGTALASAVIYVIAVNGILLNGEAVKGQTGYLKTLERDYFKLQSALVSRESPAWLEGRSRDIGMVETNNVRFIGEEPSVALSR